MRVECLVQEHKGSIPDFSIQCPADLLIISCYCVFLRERKIFNTIDQQNVFYSNWGRVMQQFTNPKLHSRERLTQVLGGRGDNLCRAPLCL